MLRFYQISDKLNLLVAFQSTAYENIQSGLKWPSVEPLAQSEPNMLTAGCQNLLPLPMHQKLSERCLFGPWFSYLILWLSFFGCNYASKWHGSATEKGSNQGWNEITMLLGWLRHDSHYGQGKKKKSSSRNAEISACVWSWSHLCWTWTYLTPTDTFLPFSAVGV